MSHLTQIEDRLKQISAQKASIEYHIPEIWLDLYSLQTKDIIVNPAKYYLDCINKIRHIAENQPLIHPKHNWSDFAVVYNMMVRLTTAYDHDANGIVDKGINMDGWRETGTFLKSMSILPYIHSLGCNTVYCLPVTEIGKVGNKGNLGSPYAIKNPYKLDDHLNEPALEMSAEVQFGAFVEAAHLLGMKVVVEFVFRTASVDSSLALDHPEWFYWIRDKVANRDGIATKQDELYGPPYFSQSDLKKIRTKVEKKNYKALIPPDKIYRNLFTDIPKKVGVFDGQIRGITEDGTACKIPSAFADWPPDDTQPVWSDVTYLRMYDHPDFNYIAYNTIRMYDTVLATDANCVKPLWDYIEGIIPSYQEKYDIDGVMVDMGHALPPQLLQNIIKKARDINPEFAFWEENFTLTPESIKKGFNAVLGYLPFDEDKPEKVRSFVEMLSSSGSPVPFFLTPETHNTKRAVTKLGEEKYSQMAWAFNAFLPGLTFIHSGFELYESMPVNTGLGFESEELKNYPVSKLPLFSVSSLNWNNKTNLTEFIRFVLNLRNEDIKPLKENYKPETIVIPTSLNPFIISFIRRLSYNPHDLIIAFNPDYKWDAYTLFTFDKDYTEFESYITGETLEIKNRELLVRFDKGGVIIGMLKIKTE
jgi:hypothetical protein